MVDREPLPTMRHVLRKVVREQIRHVRLNKKIVLIVKEVAGMDIVLMRRPKVNLAWPNIRPIQYIFVRFQFYSEAKILRF
jgi:hypothetical protein